MAQPNTASVSQAVWCWTTCNHGCQMSLIFIASHLSHCAYGEKKCPVAKTGMGLENMERHADTQEGGFSALIHTAMAAHVFMEIRMNSNLRSAGKQINKCSFQTLDTAVTCFTQMHLCVPST